MFRNWIPSQEVWALPNERVFCLTIGNRRRICTDARHLIKHLPVHFRPDLKNTTKTAKFLLNTYQRELHDKDWEFTQDQQRSETSTKYWTWVNSQQNFSVHPISKPFKTGLRPEIQHDLGFVHSRRIS